MNADKEIYDAIKTALLAEASWTSLVKPGNRIWYAPVTGTANPSKPAKADGDFNECELLMSGGDENFFTEDESFETHSPTPPSSWLERNEYRFQLVMRSQTLSIGQFTPLYAAAKKAFRRAGPRLGVPYVTQTKWRTEIAKTEEDSESSTLKWVVTINIIVNTEHNASVGD